MEKLNLTEQPVKQRDESYEVLLKDFERLIISRTVRDLLQMYIMRNGTFPDNWGDEDVVIDVKDYFDDELSVKLNILCDDDKFSVEYFKVLMFKITIDQCLYLDLEDYGCEISADEIPIKNLSILSDKINVKLYKL